MNKLESEKFQELKDLVNIISFKVAIPLYLSFWILDLIYVPHLKWEFLAVRLSIIPTALITYWWLKQAKTYQHAEQAALFLIFVCASILNVMIYTIGQGALYSVNLQLVAIGSLSFIPWSGRYFGFAVVSIYGPYLAFESMFLTDPTYHAELAVKTFFIIGVITITWILSSFRKKMHEREIVIRQDLEREIKKRAETEEDLILARDQAMEATRAKERFLANMSHEMRTPLTAIIGYSDQALDHTKPQQLHVDALKTVHQSSSHLLHIINDILDFSKIEADELQIENLPVDLAKRLSELEYMLKGQADKKALDFGVDYQFPLPESFRSDPVRIKQILLNLCSNAIKFTDEGSVRIEVRYDKDSSILRFLVRDTGIGMSDEHMSNIFTPFRQADSSIARRFGGTGLGLSLSRKLAELLGGDISVRSQNNKGSEFEFSLKIRVSDEQLKTSFGERESGDEADQKHETNIVLIGRVLLVEDVEVNQLLIKNYLEKMGVSVTCADNGEVALDLVQQNSFDLIFMDMQMPVMSGIDAVKELRKRGCTIPIIMLTANATIEDRRKCFEAGANDYLTKPIVKNKLYESSSSFLEPQEKKAG